MPRGPCGSIAGSSVSRAHRCVEHESAAMIADGCTRLFITRDALDQSRPGPGPGPGPDAEAFAARALADGEMRLAIDRFALTANEHHLRRIRRGDEVMALLPVRRRGFVFSAGVGLRRRDREPLRKRRARPPGLGLLARGYAPCLDDNRCFDARQVLLSGASSKTAFGARTLCRCADVQQRRRRHAPAVSTSMARTSRGCLSSSARAARHCPRPTPRWSLAVPKQVKG